MIFKLPRDLIERFVKGEGKEQHKAETELQSLMGARLKNGVPWVASFEEAQFLYNHENFGEVIERWVRSLRERATDFEQFLKDNPQLRDMSVESAIAKGKLTTTEYDK